MSLEDFDDAPLDTKPEQPSEQNKQIPAGDYDVELRSAVVRETSSGEVFSLSGTVLTPGKYHGWNIERAIFFNKRNGEPEEKAAYRKAKYGEMLADLKKLGFDVDNWTKENNRPRFAQVLIACGMVKGLRVTFARKAPKETGGLPNTYLNKRHPDLDGKPAQFGADEMAAHAAQSQPASSPLDGAVEPQPAEEMAPPPDAGTNSMGQKVPW